MRKLCAYFIVPYLIAIAKGSFKQIMKRKVTSKADCNFKLTPFDCLLSIVQVMSAANAHLVGAPMLQALPKNVFSRQNRKLKSANWTRSARVSMQLFHTQKPTKKIEISQLHTFCQSLNATVPYPKTNEENQIYLDALKKRNEITSVAIRSCHGIVELLRNGYPFRTENSLNARCKKQSIVQKNRIKRQASSSKKSSDVCVP